MTTLSIDKNLDLYFLGRNGLGRMCGVLITPLDSIDALHIEPIRSKGVAGRCSLQIPVSQVREFIWALEGAARELELSQPELASPSVDDLMLQYGAWGQHPNHPRSDWLYLVANGDTQRGYWEHVLASLEEERDDRQVSAHAGLSPDSHR